MTDLKPCPFCGGSAQYIWKDEKSFPQIYCFGTFDDSRQQIAPACGAAMFGRHYDPEPLVAQWNSRVHEKI